MDAKHGRGDAGVQERPLPSQPQAGAAAPAVAPAAAPASTSGPPGILDLWTFILLGNVLGLLIAASIIGRVLRRSADTTLNPAMVKTFRSRVNAWWTMYAILI